MCTTVIKPCQCKSLLASLFFSLSGKNKTKQPYITPQKDFSTKSVPKNTLSTLHVGQIGPQAGNSIRLLNATTGGLDAQLVINAQKWFQWATGKTEVDNMFFFCWRDSKPEAHTLLWCLQFHLKPLVTFRPASHWLTLHSSKTLAKQFSFSQHDLPHK